VTDGGRDFSDDNLSDESSVQGSFQHLVPCNGGSCVLEQDHPAGLCFPSAGTNSVGVLEQNKHL